MKKITLGRHLIIDYYQCSKDYVNDEKKIQELIQNIAQLIDVTIVTENYHCFEPYGITGFAIVSDSHISVHTWPEYQYIGIDIFSCKEINLDKVLNYLKKCLKSDTFEYQFLDRNTII